MSWDFSLRDLHHENTSSSSHYKVLTSYIPSHHLACMCACAIILCTICHVIVSNYCTLACSVSILHKLHVLVHNIIDHQHNSHLHTCRAVADEQRSLALGVQSVFFRLFGAIPGPIAFGAIIDSGCIYWQYECNRRGNCWVYDNSVLGIRAFAIVVSGLTLNMIFRALSWIFYPPMINCNASRTTHATREDRPPSANGDHQMNIPQIRKIQRIGKITYMD